MPSLEQQRENNKVGYYSHYVKDTEESWADIVHGFMHSALVLLSIWKCVGPAVPNLKIYVAT